MKPRKLLEKIERGDHSNIAYNDFIRLVEACGFERGRVTGSHQLFYHPGTPEGLNLQPRGNNAKAYQVRQFLELMHRYNIKLKDK